MDIVLIEVDKAFPCIPFVLLIQPAVEYNLCYDFNFFKPVSELRLLIKLFISLSS